MAIVAKMELGSGVSGELYWRLDHFDNLPNRDPDGVSRWMATAWFRAYLSEQHFKDGKGFIEERPVQFVPKWGKDIRGEAYEALKNIDVRAEEEALDQAREKLIAANEEHRAMAAEAAIAQKALDEVPKETDKQTRARMQQRIDEAGEREAAAKARHAEAEAQIEQAGKRFDAAVDVRETFAGGKDV